jgi:hypothetical protein
MTLSVAHEAPGSNRQLVLGPGPKPLARGGYADFARLAGTGCITPLAGRAKRVDNLVRVTDSLIELSAALRETAERLRTGQLEPEATLALIEECARMASEASAEVDQRTRAALEPLPDLPGQLPLPAA